MSTDVGGFVFGKLFKGKKLTKISLIKLIQDCLSIYSHFICLFNFNNSFDLYKLLLYVFFVSSVSN